MVLAMLPSFLFVCRSVCVCVCVCVCSLLRHVRLCVTPWTEALQTSLSVGILQARILEWIAMPSSRASSQPRDWTWVSCIVGGLVTIWATREDSQKCGLLPKNCLWPIFYTRYKIYIRYIVLKPAESTR